MWKPFASKKKYNALKDRHAELQTWFESAMMMIDCVPVPLLWCDTSQGFTVTYINTAAKELIGRLGDAFPATAKNVMGRHAADLFPAIAADLRAKLPDPSALPYKCRLQIGEEWIDLSFIAVLDKKKTYCGAMLSWQAVTEQVRMAQNFEATIKQLVGSVASATTELEATAQSMSAIAEETSRQATASASASEQTSTNVQTVAGAAERMAMALRDISTHAAKSSGIAGNAVQEAARTNNTVAGLT